MKIKEKFMAWRKISIFDLMILGLMVIFFLSVWGAVRLERFIEKRDLPLLESLEEVAVYPQRLVEKSKEVERIAKSATPALETVIKVESTLAKDLAAKAVKEESPRPLAPAVPLVPPAILYQAAPDYPLLAVEKNWEGITVLKLLVLKSGQVGEVKLESSSGCDLLDQAAIAGVKDWRFAPARRGAEAIEVWFKVPIKFLINNQYGD